MKVSIVIPVLNENLVLEKTLKHLASIARESQVIVVDGGSVDNTVEIAQKYAVVSESPKGRASQMNAGASSADGDVLIFLHADTILPDGAIRAVEHAFTDQCVVGGRFKVRLDQPGWRYRLVETSINIRDRFLKGFTGDQAIFIRISAFKELEGYREIALMEDLDMGRRMECLGRVVRLDEYVVTSARRWQRKGIFRTVLLMWWLKILYWCGFSPERLNRLYSDVR